MNQRTNQDEWLMQHVARGHREHLELLLRRHAGPLLTFLYRLLGDRHRSEELFQEVFLAVWTQRHQYDTARPFKPWLYAIALNKCRAAFRVRTPAALGVRDEEPAATAPSPADAAIATETAALVTHAVAQLPPQQRSVVVLRIWEDLPYETIADMVGCSEATVRSHMHHGLANLRKVLEHRLG